MHCHGLHVLYIEWYMHEMNGNPNGKGKKKNASIENHT